MRYGSNDKKGFPGMAVVRLLGTAMFIGLAAGGAFAQTSWITKWQYHEVSDTYGSFRGWAYDLARDAKGRFVAVGTWNNRIAVYRANPDRTPDSSFGIAGYMNYHLASFTTVGAYAVAVQPDGKIIVGGWGTNGTNKFLVIRLNEGGSYDYSFGLAGYTWTDFPGSAQAAVTGIAVQKDGKIVAAGSALINGRWMFALARYTASGSPDSAFDGDGKVLTNFSSSTGASGYDMVLMNDGRIVVGGRAVIDGETQFALARYLSNGALDASFDRDGKVLTNFTSRDGEEIHGLAVDSMQRIVAAGRAHVPAGDIGPDSVEFALARYNQDGSLDGTFDVDGKVLTHFVNVPVPTVGAVAYDVAVDGNTRIVAVGEGLYGSGNVSAAYRMDGSLDPSFGNCAQKGVGWGSDGTYRRRSLQSVVIVNGLPIYAENAW